MSIWENYYLAHSIQDALEALSASPGQARLIAGGTDLLLDLQQGRCPSVNTLIDVTAIPELLVIEVREDKLFVGASVPIKQIVSSDLVGEQAQALVEACELIGGPQVRNTATLGGNVAHALPAADGTIALLALGAEAEIAGLEGSRRVPLDACFRGPGQSAINPINEILTGFYLPLRMTNQASAHRRVMRPQGVAIAILNMAAWIERRGEKINNIRIAIGPAGPTPQRGRKTEDFLCGQGFSPQLFEPALNLLLSEVKFRTSPHRASSEYRRRLACILLEDTLSETWRRTFIGNGEKNEPLY